jgi:CheY-like chemotaxis protein
MIKTPQKICELSSTPKRLMPLSPVRAPHREDGRNYLMRENSAPLQPSEGTAFKPDCALSQVRTLIADDSPFGLKALAQVLSLEGNFIVVGSATDGCQAVRLTLSLKPDLVLLDYRMCHLDGIEATRHIKQFKNPPKVILVTSDNSADCKAQAAAAGADGFVDKGGDLCGQLQMLLRSFFRSSPGGN